MDVLEHRRITNEYMEAFVKMWTASNPSEAATHWQARALKAEQELERLRTDHTGAAEALRDIATGPGSPESWAPMRARGALAAMGVDLTTNRGEYETAGAAHPRKEQDR